MKKKIITALVSIMIFCVAGCSSSPQESRAIAEVNGEKLTQNEYEQHFSFVKADFESQQGVKLDDAKDKELIKSISDMTYEDLIMQRLIRQETKKQGITVNEADVDAMFDYFKEIQNRSGSDGFKKFLEDTKITEKGLRSEIEITQLYQKLGDKVAGNLQISDEEVLKYYNDNRDTFQEPGGIQIYHILVDNEQKAGEIMEKVKQGSDFATLAQEYSTDSGSKDKGGDVGLVNETTNFVPEFKQVALTLQPGQLYQQPVKSQFGYHIIKAGEKKAPTALTYEQVKVQLKQQMTQTEQEKFLNNYLEKIKSEADIKDLRAN
ncbi:MAG: peptidylprolyl isomerase [Syntrophomonas sp.]|nr:peptidylprolyl isomerase [Syntrophomonas sp.]